MRDLPRLIRGRQILDRCFALLGAAMVVLCLGVLGVLVADLVHDAAPRLRMEFFTSFPSRHAEQAGIKSALVGTLLVALVTAAVALPLGVAAGVYLEEYARKNRLTAAIEINIANLAGVPSIVWGLMALGLLVYKFHMGRNILTAGLTLAFLVLPVVIVATRESVRAIPQVLREGSYALGATRWQTVSRLVIPSSMGGILTGYGKYMAVLEGDSVDHYMALEKEVGFTIDSSASRRRFATSGVAKFLTSSNPPAANWSAKGLSWIKRSSAAESISGLSRGTSMPLWLRLIISFGPWHSVLTTGTP